MRAIAVTSAQRVKGIDVPTLKEQGIDVEIGNWRGVYGAPGITPAQRDALTDMVVKATQSKAWAAALEKNNWTPALLTGKAFDEFVDNDFARPARQHGESGWSDRTAAWRRARAWQEPDIQPWTVRGASAPADGRRAAAWGVPMPHLPPTRATPASAPIFCPGWSAGAGAVRRVADPGGAHGRLPRHGRASGAAAVTGAHWPGCPPVCCSTRHSSPPSVSS